MWPYPWTHVGTPSHLGHMDRVAATMPSQAHAGAAQEAPDIGQWEGQDVPLVRPSSCNVKGGIPSSRRYLPTYHDNFVFGHICMFLTSFYAHLLCFVCSTGRPTVKCLEICELWYVACMLAYASVLHLTICRITWSLWRGTRGLTKLVPKFMS